MCSKTFFSARWKLFSITHSCAKLYGLYLKKLAQCCCFLHLTAVFSMQVDTIPKSFHHVLRIVTVHLQLRSQTAGALCRRDFLVSIFLKHFPLTVDSVSYCCGSCCACWLYPFVLKLQLFQCIKWTFIPEKLLLSVYINMWHAQLNYPVTLSWSTENRYSGAS